MSMKCAAQDALQENIAAISHELALLLDGLSLLEHCPEELENYEESIGYIIEAAQAFSDAEDAADCNEFEWHSAIQAYCKKLLNPALPALPRAARRLQLASESIEECAGKAKRDERSISLCHSA